MSINIISKSDFESIPFTEILPRDEAEFEFNKKFSYTRSEQQIARVSLFYKKTKIGWKKIEAREIEEI